MTEKDVKKKQEKKEAASRLAVCVERLKGNRSMRQMSLDSGVATSYISAIIKGEKIPGLEVMKKLTHPSSNPQNGIRIEDLLDAVGLIDDSIPTREYAPIIDKGEDGASEVYETIKGWSEETVQLYKQMQMMICGKLVARNIMLQLKDWRPPEIPYEFSVFESPQKAFLLQIYNQEAVSEWRFYLFPFDGPQQGLGFLKDFFTQKLLPNLLFVQPDITRCVTLVVTEEMQFEKIAKYQDKIAYKGNISVVLMNMETQQFEKEIFLSLYDENVEVKKLSLIES